MKFAPKLISPVIALAIAFGGVAPATFAAVSGNVTLHANWSRSPSSVVVTLNNGNAAPGLPSGFERDGYLFIEWSTDSNASKNPGVKSYRVGDVSNWVTDNITNLYAVWQPINELYFFKAKENQYSSGSLSLGSLQYQWISGQANGAQLGSSYEVNEELHYYGVTSVNGNLVDARVRVLNTTAVKGNTINNFDYNTSWSGFKNQWLNPYVTFDRSQTEADAYFEFEIQFVRGLEQNPNSTDAVAVGPFSISVYDLDEEQFIQTPQPVSYSTQPNNSHLSTSVDSASGLFRVQSSSDSTDSADNKGRVTLNFSTLSSMRIRLGLLTGAGETGDEGAVYNLDFGLGESWGAVVPQTVNPSAPAVAAKPYEGPLNLRNQSGTLCSNGEGVLTGERLNTITEIYVGDKKVAQELLPDGRLKYSLKDIAPGTYQIRYWVPVNSVNLTDQIRVGTCSTAPVATTPGAFEASRLFANYRGDRGPVIARDRAAITAFINQYKGITSVKCVGSTSGVPAKRTDPALAQARAKNACDIVKTLVPNATYNLETSTGKGVGQRFRSVTIFISGTN